MTDKGKALRGGSKRHTIKGQWTWQLVEMKESSAWRVLSLSGHRVLDRLEIELGHHAGYDNGKLPVTYDDFEKYGIHRHAIGPAVREVVALGFVEITQEGRAGNAEWRRPTHYRLTYKPQALTEPTNDWRKIETVEQAAFIADAARKAIKKQKSSGGKRTMGQCGKGTSSPELLGAETTTTAPVRKPPLLSISRDGWTAEGVSEPACQRGHASAKARRAAADNLVSAALSAVPIDPLEAQVVRAGRQ